MPATNTQGATAPAPVVGSTPAPQAGTATTTTTADFAETVIESLNTMGFNIPDTPQNITNIEVWIAAEGGPATNPLNTSFNDFPGQPGNNATKFSSAGFPEFATTDLGAQAVALTLQQGATKYKYAPIIAALEQSASLSTFTAAVVASDWDTNHYQGTAFASGTLPPDTGTLNASPLPTGQGGSNASAAGAANAESDLLPGNPNANTLIGALGLNFLTDLTSSAWWKRVGIFALGGTIFVVGLVGFLSTTNEGKKVISEGKSAAEVAAVA